ncbi:hypothetical protein VP01_555g2 [Puccinia sorghi]|uniref:Uncharacterized protein n=1 Tax=Puccinia sorghi TaxID=27349 RepID=A0A0L6UJ60_9BASI|nr:hypothetical protein VP01_555g2 [Puccinia sorghi]
MLIRNPITRLALWKGGSYPKLGCCQGQHCLPRHSGAVRIVAHNDSRRKIIVCNCSRLTMKQEEEFPIPICGKKNRLSRECECSAFGLSPYIPKTPAGSPPTTWPLPRNSSPLPLLLRSRTPKSLPISIPCNTALIRPALFLRPPAVQPLDPPRALPACLSPCTPKTEPPSNSPPDFLCHRPNPTKALKILSFFYFGTPQLSVCTMSSAAATAETHSYHLAYISSTTQVGGTCCCCIPQQNLFACSVNYNCDFLVDDRWEVHLGLRNSSSRLRNLWYIIPPLYFAYPKNCPGFDSHMFGGHFQSIPGQMHSTPRQRGHRTEPVHTYCLEDSFHHHLFYLASNQVSLVIFLPSLYNFFHFLLFVSVSFCDILLDPCSYQAPLPFPRRKEIGMKRPKIFNGNWSPMQLPHKKYTNNFSWLLNFLKKCIHIYPMFLLISLICMHKYFLSTNTSNFIFLYQKIKQEGIKFQSSDRWAKKKDSRILQAQAVFWRCVVYIQTLEYIADLSCTIWGIWVTTPHMGVLMDLEQMLTFFGFETCCDFSYTFFGNPSIVNYSITIPDISQVVKVHKSPHLNSLQSYSTGYHRKNAFIFTSHSLISNRTILLDYVYLYFVLPGFFLSLHITSLYFIFIPSHLHRISLWTLSLNLTNYQLIYRNIYPGSSGYIHKSSHNQQKSPLVLQYLIFICYGHWIAPPPSSTLPLSALNTPLIIKLLNLPLCDSSKSVSSLHTQYFLSVSAGIIQREIWIFLPFKVSSTEANRYLPIICLSVGINKFSYTEMTVGNHLHCIEHNFMGKIGFRQQKKTIFKDFLIGGSQVLKYIKSFTLKTSIHEVARFRSCQCFAVRILNFLFYQMFRCAVTQIFSVTQLSKQITWDLSRRLEMRPPFLDVQPTGSRGAGPDYFFINFFGCQIESNLMIIILIHFTATKLTSLPAVDMQHTPAKVPSKLHLFAYVDILAQSLGSLHSDCASKLGQINLGESWSNNRSFLGVSACQLQFLQWHVLYIGKEVGLNVLALYHAQLDKGLIHYFSLLSLMTLHFKSPIISSHICFSELGRNKGRVHKHTSEGDMEIRTDTEYKILKLNGVFQKIRYNDNSHGISFRSNHGVHRRL